MAHPNESISALGIHATYFQSVGAERIAESLYREGLRQ